jgi:ketosteroid isomerase-like protein
MENDVGQDARAASTVAAIQRFHEAFNRRDVAAVMAAMTDDCVVELPYPPPDGQRFEGAAAVRDCWERFFSSSPLAIFEIEELVAWEDRAVVRWLYRWDDGANGPGHVRGIDLVRVRDGKVAESLGYVKG